MPNQLPDDIVQSVAIGNLKAIAEQPAMLSNLAYSNLVANTNLSQQNAVANQQAMNELGIAVVAMACNIVSNSVSPPPHFGAGTTTNDKQALDTK
ncbi:MAG: RebB family R body protein [Gallionella sp.]|jgi:hypothetical protein|nr:RebB family R body protein [Gallionella sp.]MCK9353211.1 RebB family R body protein [Gallionella sp.]